MTRPLTIDDRINAAWLDGYRHGADTVFEYLRQTAGAGARRAHARTRIERKKVGT